MMKYKDQLGREFTISSVFNRIISLVPSQTELLVDLGLSDRIIGVTKFCVHPDYLRKEKAVVGGTKQIDYDKIASLNPDIILCNKEENTKEIVESLQEMCVVHVSDISNIKDSYELIRQYGEIFNKEKEAIKLISQIEGEKIKFLNYIINKPVKQVVYFIWRKPWMVAASETFIDHLLGINGYMNVFRDKSRYPEVSDNELSELKYVDLILLSSEPYPFSEKHIKEIKKINPAIDIRLVDGEYFSWYGSRLKKAFAYFRLLH